MSKIRGTHAEKTVSMELLYRVACVFTLMVQMPETSSVTGPTSCCTVRPLSTEPKAVMLLIRAVVCGQDLLCFADIASLVHTYVGMNCSFDRFILQVFQLTDVCKVWLLHS